MPNNKSSRSYLEFLSEAAVKTLHESTLEILNNTGVTVDNSELREILSEVGAEVSEINFGRFRSN